MITNLVTYTTQISYLTLLQIRSPNMGEKKVKMLVAQSCPTLCNPRNYSPPGSFVQGILQARLLEWVAIPFSRGFFSTQGLGLLHCRQILYYLRHQEL